MSDAPTSTCDGLYLQQSVCLVNPWHLDRRAGLVDHNSVGIGLQDLGNQAVGKARKLHILAVEALAFPAARHSVNTLLPTKPPNSLVIQANDQERN